MAPRPNTQGAYVATASGHVLYELVGCCHCQYKWRPAPGSGTRRGFCFNCMGLLCGRDICFHEQRRYLAYAARNGWILTRSCLPHTEWCYRLQEATAQHTSQGQLQGEDFIMDATGLYIPRVG